MEGNQFDDVGVVEPQIDPKELKAQRKREKAEIRAKKKKREKHIINVWKNEENQPSVVNQRRMNYEERRQMINNEQEDTDNNLNQQEDSKRKLIIMPRIFIAVLGIFKNSLSVTRFYIGWYQDF